MPDRDALNETLQRLAAVLYGGDLPGDLHRTSPQGGRPADGGDGRRALHAVAMPAAPGPAPQALAERPAGVPVSGDVLSPGDAHRPRALHFEEGPVHVLVSAGRPDDSAEASLRQAAEKDPALRLRIEILLGPPR